MCCSKKNVVYLSDAILIEILAGSGVYIYVCSSHWYGQDCLYEASPIKKWQSPREEDFYYVPFQEYSVSPESVVSETL